MPTADVTERYPQIREIGLDGFVVRFSGAMTAAANCAALSFRAALEAEAWDGVEETSTALTSAVLRFDPLAVDYEALRARVVGLLESRDWTSAPLPPGRRLWRIPVVLGGDEGPQFAEAARLAGLDAARARAAIATARLRVLALGFAPGQPYMGELPEAWDIPRQSGLTPKVPGGALVVAIRQLIIFAGPAPTGWRQIGLTAFRCFRPGAEVPIALRPGDDVSFRLITADELSEIAVADTTGDGGATIEALE